MTASGAVLVVVQRHNATAVSIWAGLFFSGLAGGVVETVNRLEQRRRQRPAEALAAQRAADAARAVYRLMDAVFELAECSPDELATQLRRYPDRGVELDGIIPHVFPPRTRREWAKQNAGEMLAIARELETFLVAGIHSVPLRTLIHALTRSSFAVKLDAIVSVDTGLGSGWTLIAGEAADVVDVVAEVTARMSSSH